MKKNTFINFIIPMIFSIVSNNVIAGAYALTHHSRANCGNNETISWELGKTHLLQTISIHHHYGKWGVDKGHTLINGFDRTWRSASVCYGEGFQGGWKIWGSHFTKINGIKVKLASTFVTDCSIYDGWWDH